MSKLLTGVASPADIPKIIEFWESSRNASFSEAAVGAALQKYISQNPFLCLVAEQDEKIIATVVYGIKRYRGFIHHIAVDPAYIGTGVLDTLIHEAFRALARRSCSRCHIFVHDMVNNPVTNEIMENIEWARAGGSQVFTHDLEYPLSTEDLIR